MQELARCPQPQICAFALQLLDRGSKLKSLLCSMGTWDSGLP